MLDIGKPFLVPLERDLHTAATPRSAFDSSLACFGKSGISKPGVVVTAVQVHKRKTKHVSISSVHSVEEL